MCRVHRCMFCIRMCVWTNHKVVNVWFRFNDFVCLPWQFTRIGQPFQWPPIIEMSLTHTDTPNTIFFWFRRCCYWFVADVIVILFVQCNCKVFLRIWTRHLNNSTEWKCGLQLWMHKARAEWFTRRVEFIEYRYRCVCVAFSATTSVNFICTLSKISSCIMNGFSLFGAVSICGIDTRLHI